MSPRDTDLPAPPPGGWTSESLYAHLAPHRPEAVSLLGLGQNPEDRRVFWTLLPLPPDEDARRQIASLLRKVADALDGGSFRSLVPQKQEQG
jgi:hypothetical protein